MLRFVVLIDCPIEVIPEGIPATINFKCHSVRGILQRLIPEGAREIEWLTLTRIRNSCVYGVVHIKLLGCCITVFEPASGCFHVVRHGLTWT